MTQTSIDDELLEQAKNPDLVNSLAAMRRAAGMARQEAVRTNTNIIVVRNGELIRITAAELKAAGVR